MSGTEALYRSEQISPGLPSKRLEVSLMDEQRFYAWMQSEKWETVFKATNTTEKVSKMRYLINEKVNLYFPVKVYKISNQDLPYITQELKKLDGHK